MKRIMNLDSTNNQKLLKIISRNMHTNLSTKTLVRLAKAGFKLIPPFDPAREKPNPPRRNSD